MCADEGYAIGKPSPSERMDHLTADVDRELASKLASCFGREDHPLWLFSMRSFRASM
jgi:hypothetical protein